MGYVQSDFENAVQEYLQDTGSTNNNRMVEDLTLQVVGGNGSRTVFTLSKNNIFGGTSAVYLDTNQSGFSNSNVLLVNSNLGTLTTSTAPPLSGTVPTNLTCLYYFQNFTLSEIDTFVNTGLGMIATPPMFGDNSSNAFQNISPAQFNVVVLYATCEGYYTLSNRFARSVTTTAEGKSSQKDAIAKMYLSLAKEYFDRAEKERLAINGPRQGRSTLPAAVINNPNNRRSSFHWVSNR